MDAAAFDADERDVPHPSAGKPAGALYSIDEQSGLHAVVAMTSPVSLCGGTV